MRIAWDSFIINKIIKPLRVLSILLLLLISSIACVSCFDVGVSPGSICCGDWITVTISLTNTGNSVFSGRVEIYIIDANGNQDRMDGISITLQPHESRTFQTRIRPKDCKSYGTYQVVVKLVDDNGREQGTRTSSFVVKDPASCQSPSDGSKSPGCTWTFTCENNIVKRLCVDQNGREYWKEYDNCNNYNPQRECINGVCVDITTPGGPDQPRQTCNQQACQSQNRPIGTSYIKNGMQYQKYMECNCINNQCKCEEIEKPDKKPPSCDNCVSGPVEDPYLKDGMAYQKYQECNCVDGKCKCESVEKKVPCKGAISGYVYDAMTKSPIPDAKIFFCQGYCGPLSYSDASGYFSAGASCPSINTYIECHTEGYTSENTSVTTDNNGNARIRFDLEPQLIKVNIELISTGCQGYVDGGIEEPVFFRGDRIDIKINPTSRAKLTYVLVNNKIGEIEGSKVQTSDTPTIINIPKDAPIGKYYIKSKETNDLSEPFYVIFNPFAEGLSTDNINKYWKSEKAGLKIKKDIKGISNAITDNYQFYTKYYFTDHYSNTVFKFAIDIVDGESFSDDSARKLCSEIRNICNARSGSDPDDHTSKMLLAFQKTGQKINADCDVYSTLGVSLFRSIGIPAKIIKGRPSDWRSLETFHDWIEAYIEYYDNGFKPATWLLFDIPNNQLFEPRGNEYLKSIPGFKENTKDSMDWLIIKDENGNDVRSEYSAKKK